ncbi:MAG TPA: hypothetical protein PLP63_06585 [Saprospiraceae bacterium]|nr:hypothetical protein [Saprospiraceae bacterium]
MTELQLYKFINDNDVEWRYDWNKDQEDVIVFINSYLIDDFCELIKSYFDDAHIECALRDRYICVWMDDLCSHYGIELINVFPKQ